MTPRLAAVMRRAASTLAGDAALAVNTERVLADLHELRSIGAADPSAADARGGDGVPKGVVRPALCVADVEARFWLMEKAAEVGLEPTIDAIGTTLARAPRDTRGRKPLLCGSHSDTQPTGGWLDGALGVVYALEAARALSEAGSPAAIDVVNFQDEEGRFGSLTGSSVFCRGASSLNWDAVSLSPESIAPRITLREASKQHAALAGKPLLELGGAAGDGGYCGFLEAHIEQGRRLERAEQSVAAVDAIVGLRQFHVTFCGEQNHAGSTAMVDRRDAAMGAFSYATALDAAFRARGSAASVWTFGALELTPGAASIVPGNAVLTLQFRDPEESVLDEMEALAAAEADAANARGGGAGLEVRVEKARPNIDCIPLDDALRAHVEAAAELCLPSQWQTFHSGAVHDTGMMQTRMPAALMFVPSINGISHDFTEDTHEVDIGAGARVYAAAAARIVAAGWDV